MNDDELADEVGKDCRSAGLDARKRALAEYATVLTREPGSMTDANTQALRSAGITDAEILHATQVAAYFNFVNRIALGLGVELEREE